MPHESKLWMVGLVGFFVVIILLNMCMKAPVIGKPSVIEEYNFGHIYLFVLLSYVIATALFTIWLPGNPFVIAFFVMMWFIVLFGIFRDLDTIYISLIVILLLVMLVIILTGQGRVLPVMYVIILVIYLYDTPGSTLEKYSSHNMQRLKHLEALEAEQD